MAYTVEYWDENSQLTRSYRLNSYSDGTLELLDLKTKRMYLKRIFYPEVPRERLFVGSVVTVYGRALEVVAAADLGTSLYVEHETSTASCVCRVVDADGRALAAVVATLESEFTALRELKTVALDELPAATLDALGAFGPGDAALAISVYAKGRTDAAARLASALASVDFVAATHAGTKAPPGVANAAQRELESTSSRRADVTLCVLKPHVLADRKAGKLLHAIADAGFELAGLALVSLDTKMVLEFFGAYKGILARYEDVAHHMVEGPCLALMIRSPVADFRDLAGPSDVQLAKALRPKSIRANFGESNVKNAIHCTDLDDDGELECNYFFTILRGIA